MTHFETIYGHDITELLANDDKKINENDEDFKDILKSFKQTLILTDFKSEQNYSLDHEILNHGCYDYLTPQRRPSQSRASKGRSHEKFPTKLFRLLEQSDASGYDHIVSWLPHGCAFKIYDKKLFEQHVLKKYFQSSFKSFRRQLYFYGFKKIGKRFIDSGAYYHELFLRSQFDMSCKITKLDKNSELSFRVPNFDKVPRLLRNADKCMMIDGSSKLKLSPAMKNVSLVD